VSRDKHASACSLALGLRYVECSSAVAARQHSTERNCIHVDGVDYKDAIVARIVTNNDTNLKWKR